MRFRPRAAMAWVSWTPSTIRNACRLCVEDTGSWLKRPHHEGAVCAQIPGKRPGHLDPAWPGSGPPAYEGRATSTPEQAVDLIAGRWYLNLRTSANPAGELRGAIARGALS